MKTMTIKSGEIKRRTLRLGDLVLVAWLDAPPSLAVVTKMGDGSKELMDVNTTKGRDHVSDGFGPDFDQVIAVVGRWDIPDAVHEKVYASRSLRLKP